MNASQQTKRSVAKILALWLTLLFSFVNCGYTWDYGNGRHGSYVLTANTTVEQLYQTVRLPSDPAQYNPSDSNAIPNFQNLIITNGATLTANPWDGSAGGWIVIKVQGTLYINSDSAITASGIGYRGGGLSNQSGINYGIQGESYTGSQAVSTSANGGGGGGGSASRQGGGGGYGTSGESGYFGYVSYNGSGGGTYGTPSLSTVYLGSGGGGGYQSGGENGGGAIILNAGNLIAQGGIQAVGGSSGNGGSSGSGGSILLNVAMGFLGNNNVNAGGGYGAYTVYGYAGNGGDGRIAVDYAESFTGVTTPTAYTFNDTNSDTISITNQPTAQSIFLGLNVLFNVGFSTLSPYTLQWYFNGTPIPGATNQSLSLFNLSLTNQGNYWLTISNVVMAVNSSSAYLTVLDTNMPFGDYIPNWWKTQYGLSLTDPTLATNYPPADSQLTYLEIYLYGLNPLTNDTDGDGISDYNEIFVYHTNPTNAYTAGDGIPDGWKIEYGLNPLIADANNVAGFDGVTYLQVYQYDLTHTNQLNPNTPFAVGSGLSNYELINNGQHTNNFYYDHEDRLLGMESSRGISIGYQYDGNRNLLQQNVLSRAGETNGLPVLWLWLNGLTNEPGIAYEDSSGNGWNNYQEWLAGLSPNSNSVPSLLNNPGTNIASLTLPFTPSNFIEAVGNLDRLSGDEIVVGADGNPGTNNNYLFILTQTATNNWSTQKVSVGSFGITSIAVGQPTNRPSAGIYVGLRGTNGSGQVMEFISIGGIWQSNLIVASTNSSTFILGVRNLDLLASLSPTNGSAGALYSLSFSNSAWNQNILSTNGSHRISGSVGIVAGGVNRQSGFRLLDGSGIEVSDIGKEFLGNRSLIPSNSVYYAKTDKWYFQTASDFWQPTESACEALGGKLVTINSADENQWLHTTYPFTFHIGYYANASWTGYYSVYGSWQWISGAPTIYRQWGTDPSGSFSTSYISSTAAYMGTDGSWNVELLGYIYFSPPPTLPGIGDLVGAGGLSVLPEPSAANRLTRNTSLLPCYTRPNQTNGFSILYAYVDDKNASGVVDVGDDFVLEELLVVTNGWTTNTLDRETLTTTSLAASYGIATADLTGSNFKLPFTAEPDGQLFYWTTTNSTAPLQRNLFSPDYLGDAWNGLAGVNTSGLGQGLAGLMVSPTNQNVCNVIFWSPQAVLPTPQPSVIESAPYAAVLPSSSPLGTNAVVIVRLWHNEGDASTPFIQYQYLGVTNWQNAKLTTLDDLPYNTTLRVSALPGGTNHFVTWNVLSDVGFNVVTNVLLRASASDFMLTGSWSLPTPFEINTVPIANTNLMFGLSQLMSDGRFQLTVSGGSLGQSYTLLGSTDLLNWIPISGVIITNPPVTIYDPYATNYRWRFYKIGPLSLAPATQLGVGSRSGSGQAFGSNGLNLTMYSLPGFNYQVEASTDLVNWLVITNYKMTNSPFYFNDPNASNFNQRFYRTILH